jgi:cytochrome P450
MPPGMFLRDLFKCHILRRMKLHRMIFDIFDSMVIGRDEKETIENSDAFRRFLKKIITGRRTEMAKADFVSKGDFLTMLLQDELFRGDDEYIVDECLTFMAAATQTTTILISNAIYYLSKNHDKLGILR